MTVRFAAGEPDGLAWMLGRLLEANLDRHPGRRRLLRPAAVTVEAPDAGVSVGLRFAHGEVVVGEPAGAAQVHVRADSHDLLRLAATPLRLGFPDPFATEGRAMLRLVLSRRVRIRGMLRHPVVTSRLARLLSAL